MARRAALGGFSLNLFGGGGVDAGVFNIASTAAQSKSNEAYLGLTRVETQWEGGKVSNAEYLAALGAYANSFDPGTSEYLNQQSRLESTTYRIERNVMVSRVNSGSASLNDLLNYDLGKLSGLNPDSQEYLDRLGYVTSTQNQLLNDEEKDVAAAYGDGLMTTAQYQEWYKLRAADPRFTGNAGIAESIESRIRELDGRIIDERDSQMVADYTAGKISPDAFLLYAGDARQRYADGTSAAKDWDKRIDVAQDAMVEDDLNYRFSLSQDYARLAQFVASNKAPTSTTRVLKGTASTRTVLGADGNWKVVTTRTGAGVKTYAPTKAELAAWEKRKVEIESAKKQMAAIATKVGTLEGGFVSSTDMLGFYNKQLGGVAKGTSEWYAIQGKIDGLNAQIASEKVLARQGVKITYPKGGGGTTTAVDATGGTGKAKSKSTGTGDLEDFMRVIAKIESGGRYEARNGTTGAYGKYQILPSNWASYAKKAGLPANAKPTPENQEKVARAAFERYYDKYDGDWAKMAAAWHAGVAGTAGGPGTGNWGPKTSNYVNKVMSAMGSAAPAPSGGGAPRPSGSIPSSPAKGAASGGGGATSGTGKGAATLKVITGIKYAQPGNIAEQRRYASELPAPKTTWQTESLPIGKGVEGATFDKVYAAVEKAFLKGENEASITLGGGEKMVVFMGDDPTEKLAFMRDMDDSRVNLRDAEAVFYKGERSGAAKSAAALVARKEAAGHELVALSFAGNDVRYGEGDKPLAAGVRTLDGILKGVELHTRLMNEAWERNDVTAAYLESQYLKQLTSPTPIVINGQQVPVGDLNYLNTQIESAKARVKYLTGKTGESVDTLLNGMGQGGTEFKNDFEKLDGALAAISKAAEAGVETQNEMNNMLAKSPDGQVIWLGQGAQTQVVLGPNVLVTVDKNGKTKKQLVAPGIGKDGKLGPLPPDKSVKVFLKTGSGTGIADVYADYTVGRVGTMRMPDGSDVALMGKIVMVNMDRDNNGVNDSTSLYFENPLNPGKWSASPIAYNAPKGAKIVYQGGAEAITFQFDQNTQVMLTPDKATGVYVVNAAVKQGGGMINTEPEMVPVGTPDASADAKAYLNGFTRDKSGLDPYGHFMSDSPIPAVGFTAKEWASMQVPGAAGSMKLGPAAPGPGYTPSRATPALTAGNSLYGIGDSAERAQRTSEAKARSDAAAANVAQRQSEIASGNTPTTAYQGIPLPAAPKPGALGVNLNADLRAVDNAIGGRILPPKPKAATTAYKGIPTPAPKPKAATTAYKGIPTPAPKVITPLPKPGVVGSGLKAK